MILRVFRGSAPSARALDVGRLLAGPFLDASRAMEGLTSYAGGLRMDESSARFVICSTWDTMGGIARETQGRLNQAAFPLAEWMTTEGAEHYELVGEPVAIHVATPDAVIRFARMTIRPGEEEAYYAAVRRGLARMHTGGELLAYHLGRRVARRHQVAAVSIWTSAEALRAHVEPETGEPLWASEIRPLVEAFEVEHFDAVPAGPRG